MKFCPECESLLHYREKDGKLVHKCNGCNYISETNETIISQNSYLSNNNPTFGNKKNFIHYRERRNMCVQMMIVLLMRTRRKRRPYSSMRATA
jgi:DNA-directed RNA polymerase subunit M/transcription elongation factor TFIIS